MIDSSQRTISLPEVFTHLDSFGFCLLKSFVEHKTMREMVRDFELITSTPNLHCCRDLNLESGKAISIKFGNLIHTKLSTTQGFFSQNIMQKISNAFWGKEIKINTDIYVMHEIPGTTILLKNSTSMSLRLLSFSFI